MYTGSSLPVYTTVLAVKILMKFMLIWGGNTMLHETNEQQIGAATYVIERVFTGTKTIQEVVTEEIIFTGKQAANFDQQDSRMV